MARRIQLTKRNYLGEGYLHLFRNDATGAQVIVSTDKEQYEKMGLPGGEKFNPVLPGHTWECSLGGTLKVDSPTGFLGENEYTVRNGKAVVSLKDARGDKREFDIPEVINDEIWL